MRNVLLFFELKKMYQQIAEYCQIEVSLVENLLEKTGWGDSYEKGEIDSWTLFHKLPPEIQGSKGFSRWMEAISNVFKPNDLINPLIKELKKNQVQLLIVSNICEAHFSYAYTHFPILHLFDDYILSYELKTRKPDSKIYEEALQKAGPNKTCFYVDAVQEYIEKARLLGIDSEIYQDPDTFHFQLKDRGFLP